MKTSKTNINFKFYDNEDGTLTVEGIASTPNIDNAREVVTKEAMQNAINGYLKYGAIRQQHEQSKPIGTAKDVYQDEKGNTIIKFIAVTDESIKLIKTGVLKALSIGFLPIKFFIKNGIKYYTEIKWLETSPVDIPCNDDCLITFYKINNEGENMTIEQEITEEQAIEEINNKSINTEVNQEEVIEPITEQVTQDVNTEVNKGSEEIIHEAKEMSLLIEIKELLLSLINKESLESEAEMESKSLKIKENLNNEIKLKYEQDLKELEEKKNKEIELIKKQYEDDFIELKTNIERFAKQQNNKSFVFEDKTIIDNEFTNKNKDNKAVIELYQLFNK